MAGSTAEVVRLKRGDSLRLACAVQQANGAPVSPEAATVRAQVRTTAYTFLAELVLQNRNDAAGTLELFAGKDMAGLWAPGEYACDVEYGAHNGDATSTKTFSIMVETSVTR